MQLIIKQKLSSELTLPIGYHHIIQSIIYSSIRGQDNYSDFIHDKGYSYNDRQFRMFTFSLLKGKYSVSNGRITFRDEISFEVRSPDNRLIKIIKESIEERGIRYPDRTVKDIYLSFSDYQVDEEQVLIRMGSPLSVYSTDAETKQTYFYTPEEGRFSLLINDNFKRKYSAYTGITPNSDVIIKPAKVSPKDKYVTNYKGFYLSGWMGQYELRGEKKYLDFLYQTGIGAKNAQGFGLFYVI